VALVCVDVEARKRDMVVQGRHLRSLRLRPKSFLRPSQVRAL
jgi:hypothetical protein